MGTNKAHGRTRIHVAVFTAVNSLPQEPEALKEDAKDKEEEFLQKNKEEEVKQTTKHSHLQYLHEFWTGLWHPMGRLIDITCEIGTQNLELLMLLSGMNRGFRTVDRHIQHLVHET
ncbi:hypothetical protein YC2023_020207 [Brassica napus]